MLIKKDFNILGTKVSTTTATKDIAMVSNINSYVQKIEHITKTQKGELPGDPFIGSNYYDYIFQLPARVGFLESDLKNSINYGVMDFSFLDVQLLYFDEDIFRFQVIFTVLDNASPTKQFCQIEVQKP